MNQSFQSTDHRLRTLDQIQLMLTSLLFIFFSLTACMENPNNNNRQLPDPEFDKYWYQGEAEITSYKLEQARYGEIHEGTVVLVFVTEPFSKSSMTKADNPGKDDPSVLKLNYTKKFNTGIYPYSMMTSTFLPVNDLTHSIKISSSSQEWCGHTFMEMENKGKFDINIKSYFESESKSLKLDKALLEDDVMSMIRINPNALPTGKMKMIPSFFALRMSHKQTKAYDVVLSLEQEGASSIYTAAYPSLERSIAITFDTNFPHQITGWEETGYSGYGANRKKLTTTATKMKSIKSAYWNKNSKNDAHLRKELGL